MGNCEKPTVHMFNGESQNASPQDWEQEEDVDSVTTTQHCTAHPSHCIMAGRTNKIHFRKEVIKLYMQKTGLYTQIILSKLQKWNLISDFGKVAEYKISITKINSTSNSEKQKMESKNFKV